MNPGRSLLDPTNPNSPPLYNITPGPLIQGFRTNQVGYGSLGNFDLSAVQNGNYVLDLLVQSEGLQTNVSLNIQVASNLKIGQFSFSEQDLVVPVAGIPLTVTRTYNSLNPLSSDFGYGWTFSLNSMDVQLDEDRTNVTIGESPTLVALPDDTAPLPTSIRIDGGWDVTLNLPDGRRTTFLFNPRVTTDGKVYAGWTAPPDVHATLGVYSPFSVDSSVITFRGGVAYWADSQDWPATFENHDLPGYVLTNYDGTQFFITRGQPSVVYYTPASSPNPITINTFGPPVLTRILQRSGDTITISSNGISHSINGTTDRTITFTRDQSGRISAINDPNGGANPVAQYFYDSSGNLSQVLKLQDRNAGTYSTNRYWYTNSAFPHYITKVDNGLGVPIAMSIYDSNGRLISTVDANGNTNQFIHNLTNSLEIVVDRRGNTNTYSYDSRGNVLAITNALKGVTLNTYDSTNNKLSEVFFLNNTPYSSNTFSYDNNGMLLASANTLGFSNVFTYNSYGQVLTATDARGKTSTNYYDTFGNLTGTSDALTNTTANFYATSTQLLMGSRDAVGTLTTNLYDAASGNLTGTETFVGTNIFSTNTFRYDLAGNRTSSTVWRRVNGNWSNAVTSFIYDGQNRVVQTIDPDGGTNLVVFDPAGRQTHTIDKLSRTTSYSYDWAGHLVTTTFPDLTTTSNFYDPNGNRIMSIDQLGRTNTYIYDPLNRLTNTVFADNSTSTTVYDDLGRVKFSIDGLGVTNAFGYDVLGRRVAVTNAWGLTPGMTNGFVFDQNGNQTAFIDGLGNPTTYVFDALNRQTQVQYADSKSVFTVYDAVGRRIWQTNQDKIVTGFTYDGVGRLLAVTNGIGGAPTTWAQYQYDEAGNEIAQVDALGRTTTFGYDSMGRRIKRTLPGLQAEFFAYDLVGNVTNYTSFNGVVITNQYDSLNRLFSRTSSNGYSATFAYSATGQRTSMTDVTGTTTYGYDKRDRLMAKTNAWNSGPTVWLNYKYDANGNLTNLWEKTSGGVTNFFQFDPLNRLTNLVAGGSAAASYVFDSNGNLKSSKYGNGAMSLFQFDPLNRLTNSLWNSGTTASFYYQLGATGNRTNLIETLVSTGRTNAWAYDSLYRLTNETFTGGTSGGLSYGLDPVGNRTNRTVSGSLSLSLTNQPFTFSTNDWQTSSDSYDSNGNTLSSSGNSFQYDPLNHLIAVNNPSVTLGYDGDGNRVRRTYNGTNTFFLIDDRNPTGYAQALEEWSVSGSTTTLSRVYNYGLQPVSQTQSGTTYYFVQDGHGSTRLVLDSSGNVVNWFVFDSYGILIASNATPVTPILYCGEYVDPVTGLCHLRGRELLTGTGRFATLDTAEGEQEHPVSLHKYIYCADDPVDLSDPSGNDFEITGIMDLMSMTSEVVGLGSRSPIAGNHWRFFSRGDVDVYIWRWSGGGFIGYGASVGHVMVTAAGKKDVYLSQFPHKFGEHNRVPGIGHNNKLNWAETVTDEGRSPDEVFRIYLPCMDAFKAKAQDHVSRPEWVAVPEFSFQTHCARAAYDALKAGGLELPPNRGGILPGKLGSYLEQLANDPAKSGWMTKWRIERESTDYNKILLDSYFKVPW